VRDHPQLVRGLVLAEPPIFSLLTASEEGDAARRTFFTYALDPARAAFVRGDSVAGVRLFFDATTGRGAFNRLTPAGARACSLMPSSYAAKCSRSAATTCRRSRAPSSVVSRRRCCSFGANEVRACFS